MLTPGFPSGAVRVGMHLVDLSDVRKLLAHERHRLRRLFTEGELATCEAAHHIEEAYAQAWCAKVAGMKALGEAWPEVPFTGFEVRQGSSRPRLTLHGLAQEAAGRLHLLPKDLSLTSTRTVAAAVAIFVQE